jgi:hypothetical protein
MTKIYPRSVSILVLLMGTLCVVQAAQAQLRYDQEYPAIAYSTAQTTDSISRLKEAIERGEVELEYRGERGYLDSLLEALEIDPSSQLLVFSKTALKARVVTSETPRAIYFNDNAYVAFIQDSRGLEMSAMDPNLGSVFFTLSQNPEEEFEMERQMNRCLRCHDSYSLSGGGVPRFLLSSVLAAPDGSIVSHEYSIITNTSTPIRRRWGGWYVTGISGEQEHMGNFIIDDFAMLTDLNLSLYGNREELSDILNVEPYISSYSDIVALLVLEHQIEVQNLMVRVNYDIRTILDAQGSIDAEKIQEITEPLLQSLLMANEAPLADEVTGVSGFTEYFQTLGPMDSEGRSLRELDLKTRTFRYPLSYQIYSEAFDALPDDAIAYLYRRLNEVLEAENAEEEFSHLSIEDRSAILEILQDTKPSFSDF